MEYFGVNIEVGKITPLPMNIGNNINPVYYVYEYYIQSTGEIFYVGKGSSNRIYNHDRNDVFNRIVSKYDINYRKLEDDLTEQQAFDLEERTIKKYLDQGMFLANVQVPLGYRGVYYDYTKYDYMKTPELISNPTEIHYFGKNDDWDRITDEDLLKTYFWSDCRMREQDSIMYFKDNVPYISWYANEFNKQVGIHLHELIEHKINKNARVFKTINAKSSRSIILPIVPTTYKLKLIRESNKKLFHLVDVLDYLDVDIEKFKELTYVELNTQKLIDSSF